MTVFETEHPEERDPMVDSYETRITRAILDAYHEKVSRSLVADVVVVGAGPSGLMAAITLAAKGRTVTVLEKRLWPGGGVWGGAMGMNEVVLEAEAMRALEGVSVRLPTQGRTGST
jgi:sulfide-dependent adenosine diphosphate thiazole synthase